MGKIGCKEKNHLENMENKNMTVKTKKKFNYFTEWTQLWKESVSWKTE